MRDTGEVAIYTRALVRRDKPLVRWLHRSGELSEEMQIPERLHKAFLADDDGNDCGDQFLVEDVEFVIEATFYDEHMEQVADGSAVIRFDAEEVPVRLDDVPDLVWRDFVEAAACA